MAVAHKGIQTTTITKHLREVQENVMDNQIITAMLQKKGTVSYNHSGKNFDWPVRKSRSALIPYGDMQAIIPERVNRYETATLDWRGYVMPQLVSKMDKLQNRGKEAIVNFVGQVVDKIIDDIKSGFAAELYLDGNAAGREKAIHGFKSWLGNTGSDQYTAPSDTYAGLSTVLANYGGSVISGTYPFGKFDAEYKFWSPLIVNYTHANWGATATWAANCIEALRKGIHGQIGLRGSTDGKIDCVVCTSSMYTDFLNQLDEKERIIVERNKTNSPLVSLGFGQVVNFDGVDITADNDCPATEAYGINFGSLELLSMQSQLFVPTKDFDFTTLSDQYAVDFMGNMKGNPAQMVFWNDIT